MRAAVELHVAGCELCREELHSLEEAGAAFAEFAVGEPPAQHFAGYGRIVRARMARGTGFQPVVHGQDAQATHAAPRRGRVVWGVMFGASAAAAAALFLVLSRGLPVVEQAPPEVAKADPVRASEMVSGALAPLVVPTDRVTALWVLVPDGQQGRRQDFYFDPRQPDGLKALEDQEGQYGYLVASERTTGDERPLLGAYLKTTRDVDRDVKDRLGLMVYDVDRGSPAHLMGLRPKDYIVTVNDMEVKNGGVEEAAKFFAGIKHAGAGTPIKLIVVRFVGGEPMIMVKEGILGKYAP
jgi:hypothetical protein